MKKRTEIESICLTAAAAVPLYVTEAASIPRLILFDSILLLAILQIVFSGARPVLPRLVLTASALAYLPFYFFDAFFVTRSLIGASCHLLLFIAVYQIFDSSWETAWRKRLLVTFMIFLTSLATSTHISVTLFVIGFAFLMFRQLIDATRLETLASIEAEGPERPSSRLALAFLCASLVAGAALFPLLPRIKSPLIRGMAPELSNASTGIGEVIDFSSARSISADPEVLARVWMPQDAVAMFAPLRLRARTYDVYEGQTWRSSRPARRGGARRQGNGWRIASPGGFSREITVQQRLGIERQIYFPVGTHTVSGIPYLLPDGRMGVYRAATSDASIINYRAQMSRQVEPLDQEQPGILSYQAPPQIRELALSVAGDASTNAAKARRIEQYLLSNYRYLANPAELGRPVPVEEFLLKEKRGHCEYFAAGAVVLLTSLDVPARIVGGFYGGELNPLTGYFVIRQRDAHAWVEVFEGGRWLTFDPTPADMRPGSASSNLFRAYASAIAESVTFIWDRYILTYGLDDQTAFLASVFEGFTNLVAALGRGGANVVAAMSAPAALGVLIGLLLTVSAAAYIRVRQRSTFEKLLAALSRAGLRFDVAASPGEVLRQVELHHPEMAVLTKDIIDVYLEERFSTREVTEGRKVEAKRALREIREKG